MLPSCAIVTVVLEDEYSRFVRWLTGVSVNCVGFLLPGSPPLLLDTYRGDEENPFHLAQGRIVIDGPVSTITIYPLNIPSEEEKDLLPLIHEVRSLPVDHRKEMAYLSLKKCSPFNGFAVVNGVLQRLKETSHPLPLTGLMQSPLLGRSFTYQYQVFIEKKETDPRLLHLVKLLASSASKDNCPAYVPPDLLPIRDGLSLIIDNIQQAPEGKPPLIDIGVIINAFNNIADHYGLLPLSPLQVPSALAIVCGNGGEETSATPFRGCLPSHGADLSLLPEGELLQLLRFLDSIQPFDRRFIALQEGIARELGRRNVSK